MCKPIKQINRLLSKALVREEQLDGQEMEQLATTLGQLAVDQMRIFVDTWRKYIKPDQQLYYANPDTGQTILRMIDTILSARERARVGQMDENQRVRTFRRYLKVVMRDDIFAAYVFRVYFAPSAKEWPEVPSINAKLRLALAFKELHLNMIDYSEAMLRAALVEARQAKLPLLATQAWADRLLALEVLDPDCKQLISGQRPPIDWYSF